ncbi:MAG: elongation factor G [Selenomonadaceae bacterium]|nr:elongation factor G [Selenomonadaceae bacterium]
MKEYSSDHLRNVVFLGHGNCGKTTVLDACLYHTGTSKRRGSVDDGTSRLDVLPEEQERKLTVEMKLAACEFGENKLNLLDTPGYPDFVGEAIEGIAAADAALFVISAHSGVEVETEKLWRLAAEADLPRAFFINKMDREHVNFQATVDELRVRFGPGIVPVQLPIGQEAAFQGVVDLLAMRGKVVFHDAEDCTFTDIPEYLAKDVAEARQALIEAAADYDETLLEKYVAGEEIGEDEVTAALLQGIYHGDIFPVFCGSAKADIGIKKLMNCIVTYLPSPLARAAVGTKPDGSDLVERRAGDPFSAQAFKTEIDPSGGKKTYLRLYSGDLMPDTTVKNTTDGTDVRIGKLMALRGKESHQVAHAHAGDIVVTAKLGSVGTGDTLAAPSAPIVYENLAFPEPMLEMAAVPIKKGDDDKLFAAIEKEQEEDHTLVLRRDAAGGQALLSGMGEMHLEMLRSKLARKYHAGLELVKPRVAYRETIRQTAKAEGKYKKQSGGHGQYGDVFLEVEPREPGSGILFTENVFGGAVPRQFIPAVEKGVQETLEQGIYAGFPVTDIHVNLYDGSSHSVDSSEAAFKAAAAIALKKAVRDASPTLLEPMDSVDVQTPEYYVGDVIGRLSGKRARILGTELQGKDMTVIHAIVPEAELYAYATELRSQTQGRGTFTRAFLRYEEVPEKQTQEILDAQAEKREKQK